MTDFYLAESLQEISPELVMEASLPLRRKKNRNRLAFAACFALVSICSFTLSQMGMGGAGSDTAAPEDSFVGESLEHGIIEDSIAGNSSAKEDGATYDYVVYDTSHQQLISFDLQEMYARSDTVVIGRFDGDFTQYEESGVGIHLYSFTVEEAVKGDPAETVSIRLPVWRRVDGDIEGDRYSFVVSDATFFDPTENGQVMLFLQKIESGVYRKAQEPFTLAICTDGTVTLRSNLLLPYEERQALSTTEALTENGNILLYTDDLLCSVEPPAKESISGMHINDILEAFGSDLRILY